MIDKLYFISEKQLQQLINVSSVDERKIIVREIKKHEVIIPVIDIDPTLL
jgi:hypothetical protein